jgi:hypothetical protein
MRVYWKLIIFEVLLEILLGVAPGNLDTIATMVEYLLESSREASRATLVLLNQTVACTSNFLPTGSVSELGHRA